VDHVTEESTAVLSCTPCGNSVITAVNFAAYGTASGTCDHPGKTPDNDFKPGRCTASRSSAILEQLCVGKRNCTIEVSNAFFGGDPCDKTHKWLSAAVACSATCHADVPPTGRIAVAALGAANDACTSHEAGDVGRVCYNMRTGSLYEETWTLPKGAAQAQNHEYIEGRYGELLFNDTGADAASHLSVSAWVVRQRYSRAAAANMTSSSTTLNAVWELCRYTGEATTLDLIADSNARQRSTDCMADDNTAMRTLYATSGQLALQRNQMLQAFTACGTIGKDHGCRAEWTVLPLVMLRDDALYTGDLTVARNNFDALVPSSLLAQIDNVSGLVVNDNVLIDWPSGMRDNFVLSPTNAVANAFAYYGLSTLVELATWLNRSEDAARYQAIEAKLKTAINRQMWNGTAFCDGVCSNISHTAFHSTVYLLAVGAVSDDNMLAAWQYTRGRISPPFAATGGVVTGPASRRGQNTWPPPPPPSSHWGMPCGTYVSPPHPTPLFRLFSSLVVCTTPSLWYLSARQLSWLVTDPAPAIAFSSLMHTAALHR